MKITEIAFASYPVTDIAKSRAFYEGLLGLKATSNNETPQGHWVEYEIGAGAFGIGCAPGWKPSADGACVAFEMDDFDAAIAKLKAANVSFKMGPFETPVCHMAMVHDPDGSVLIIHKRKPGHH